MKLCLIFLFAAFVVPSSQQSQKDRLLRWVQSKTREYKNVEITNLSSSFSNGLGFCALLHHFRPRAFDYGALSPSNPAANFHICFRAAKENRIAEMVTGEEMLAMGRRPDAKVVFTQLMEYYKVFQREQ